MGSSPVNSKLLLLLLLFVVGVFSLTAHAWMLDCPFAGRLKCEKDQSGVCNIKRMECTDGGGPLESLECPDPRRSLSCDADQAAICTSKKAVIIGQCISLPGRSSPEDFADFILKRVKRGSRNVTVEELPSGVIVARDDGEELIVHLRVPEP